MTTIPNSLKKGLEQFLKVESASGLLLGISALLAFAIANSSQSDAYFSILEIKIIGLLFF